MQHLLDEGREFDLMGIKFELYIGGQSFPICLKILSVLAGFSG
jgi:hypothetical protein